LKHSITALDHAFEALASAFVSGANTLAMNSDIDEFISELKKLRKTYQKGATQAEKWGIGDVMWRED